MQGCGGRSGGEFASLHLRRRVSAEPRASQPQADRTRLCLKVFQSSSVGLQALNSRLPQPVPSSRGGRKGSLSIVSLCASVHVAHLRFLFRHVDGTGCRDNFCEPASWNSQKPDLRGSKNETLVFSRNMNVRSR